MGKSKLLEQTRQTCRLHHLSYRTKEVYLLWIERFIATIVMCLEIIFEIFRFKGILLLKRSNY
jgi:hypothetical protein